MAGRAASRGRREPTSPQEPFSGPSRRPGGSRRLPTAVARGDAFCPRNRRLLWIWVALAGRPPAPNATHGGRPQLVQAPRPRTSLRSSRHLGGLRIGRTLRPWLTMTCINGLLGNPGTTPFPESLINRLMPSPPERPRQTVAQPTPPSARGSRGPPLPGRRAGRAEAGQHVRALRDRRHASGAWPSGPCWFGGCTPKRFYTKRHLHGPPAGGRDRRPRPEAETGS